MTKSAEPSVVYVGCTAPARDVLETLLERGVPITAVVTIGRDMASANAVSGYASLRPTAEKNGLEVYEPRRYAMDTDADFDFFETVNPDLLIVNGWQRLIPESILETTTHGALGNHGSAFGLPKGRGRSPLNWSLIEGRDRFLLSVIRLDPGADSGDVVTTTKFDITTHDTIETLYYKVTMCLKQMLLEVVDPILAGERPFEPQAGEPTYYPKRNPEDGEINWGDGTQAVYNLVRAVADPYPGAFTHADDDRIMIWDAIPFSADLEPTARAGTVVEVFWTGDFVVATADGTILVREWESPGWEPAVGDRFDSSGTPDRVDSPDNHANLSSDQSND